MLPRDDQRERLGKQVLVGDIRRIAGHEAEADVQAPRLQFGLDAARGALLDADGYARIVARHAFEHRQHPGHMQRGNDPEVDVPGHEFRDVVHRRASLFELVQHYFGAAPERRAGLRELHPLADAPEERRTQDALELRDLLGHARLRDAQALGGAREVLGRRDGEEIAQVPDLDALIHH